MSAALAPYRRLSSGDFDLFRVAAVIRGRLLLGDTPVARLRGATFALALLPACDAADAFGWSALAALVTFAVVIVAAELHQRWRMWAEEALWWDGRAHDWEHSHDRWQDVETGGVASLVEMRELFMRQDGAAAERARQTRDMAESRIPARLRDLYLERARAKAVSP